MSYYYLEHVCVSLQTLALKRFLPHLIQYTVPSQNFFSTQSGYLADQVQHIVIVTLVCDF